MGDLKSRKKINSNGELDRLDEIYRRAAVIICEKGFDATSMSDIAEAVGLTKAGIYHYVPGKKELLYAIMSYAMDLLEIKVIAPARMITNAEQRLCLIINNHVKLIAKGSRPEGYSPLSILTDEIAGLTKTDQRRIIARKRVYLDLVRETLEQLQAESKLKNIDVTVGAFSLFGMLLLISRWYRPDGALTSEQVAEEIGKIVFGGMLLPLKN